MKVGFIGLGIMGSPMAANLIKGGHQLFLFSIPSIPQSLVDRELAQVKSSAREDDKPKLKVGCVLAVVGEKSSATIRFLGDNASVTLFGVAGAGGRSG